MSAATMRGEQTTTRAVRTERAEPRRTTFHAEQVVGTPKTGVLRQREMTDVSYEQIQRRAYEIFLSRNGKPGNAVLDWLEAEQSLRHAAKLARQAQEC